MAFVNPWDLRSIYDLLVFKCPECFFDTPSKQSIINHACEDHPESISCLENIADGSLEDVLIPSCAYIKVEEPLIESNENDILDNDIIENDILDDSIKCEVEIKEEKPKKKSDVPTTLVGINCLDCDQQFKNYYRLSRHVITSHENGVIKSEDSSQEMDNHLKVDHSSTCVLCRKPYESVLKHLAEDHQRVEFGCTSCQVVCDSEKDMLDHLKSCGNSIKCAICCSSFSFHKHLKRHIRTAHWGLSRNETQKAGKKKQPSDSLVKKTKVKTDQNSKKEDNSEGPAKFQCHLCGSYFARKYYMKKHIENTHEGKRDYQCIHCGKCCTRKTGLNKHMARFHKDPTKFQCDKCPRTFGVKRDLQQHVLNVHDGVRDFKCIECNKGFFSKSNYEAHVRIVHRGERDFKCDLCGKGFTREKYLESHKVTCRHG